MLAKGVVLFSLPLLLLGSVTIHSDICRMPTQPVVTAPVADVELADPTTTVKGTTTQYSTVTIKTNGRSLGNTTSDASGDFQVQVTLDRGSNHLTLQTSNPCGTGSELAIDLSVAPAPYKTPPSPSPTPDTPDDTVAPPGASPGTTPSSLGTSEAPAKDKTTPPKGTPSEDLAIRITSPNENFTTSDDSVFLTGVTNIEATEIIEVNHTERARLNMPSTTFGVLVPLHMGKNTIKVVASAKDQSATTQLHVTRIAATAQQSVPWYEHYVWLILPLALAAVALLSVIFLRRRKQQP